MNFKLKTMCAGAMAFSMMLCGCNGNRTNYLSWPTYDGEDLEMVITDNSVDFALWSPKADEVELNIYPTDKDSEALETIMMSKGDNGVWRASISRENVGKFYTFKVKYDGKWLAETPGVWAKAVGTNGMRAAILDVETTNPEGWSEDKGPELKNITDAVIYEMHHRDFSVDPTSGIVNKGK
ncbi:MAG: type I pullulanase, partial [Muribaculaceae bacterium]|nr:type I pullulanase [Muribaculaceae bacterium]